MMVVGCVALCATSCSFQKAYVISQKHRVYTLEQVDFHFLADKYVNKEHTSMSTVEGIYSVSSVVTKKNRQLLSGQEKEKVKDREENYTKVMIIRDNRNPERDFIEISLDKQKMPSYSVIGEFKELAESSLLIYKHFDPRGKTSTSYTFSYDKAKDILEGVRVENENNAVITYKLTYMKLEPTAKSANY
jgi:hypothetical protein